MPSRRRAALLAAGYAEGVASRCAASLAQMDHGSRHEPYESYYGAAGGATRRVADALFARDAERFDYRFERGFGASAYVGPISAADLKLPTQS